MSAEVLAVPDKRDKHPTNPPFIMPFYSPLLEARGRRQGRRCPLTLGDTLREKDAPGSEVLEMQRWIPQFPLTGMVKRCLFLDFPPNPEWSCLGKQLIASFRSRKRCKQPGKTNNTMGLPCGNLVLSGLPCLPRYGLVLKPKGNPYITAGITFVLRGGFHFPVRKQTMK